MLYRVSSRNEGVGGFVVAAVPLRERLVPERRADDPLVQPPTATVPFDLDSRSRPPRFAVSIRSAVPSRARRPP